MSRIGKKPVPFPATVKVTQDKNLLTVKGPKGELKLTIHPALTVAVGKDGITVTRSNEERQTRALHGLARSLINNTVQGVINGYEKKLKIEGVGYQAKLEGDKLSVFVGFSHPVVHPAPAGVKVQVPDPNTIIISGIDKQLVGQYAAVVRKTRPPEPYKGKGIRYENEVVRRKEGKKFASGGGG
jgi:large subunit ribosomal protein L6